MRLTISPSTPTAAAAMASVCAPRTSRLPDMPRVAVAISTATPEADERRGEDPAAGRPVREHASRGYLAATPVQRSVRAITSRWISFVPS